MVKSHISVMAIKIVQGNLKSCSEIKSYSIAGSTKCRTLRSYLHVVIKNTTSILCFHREVMIFSIEKPTTISH